MKVQTMDMLLLLVVLGILLCIHGIHGQEAATGRRRDRTRHADPVGPGGVIQGTPPPLPPIPPMPEVPEMDVSCSMRFQCEERFGLPLSYHDKNCYCDKLCETYADCCTDYTRSESDGRPKKLPRNTYSCQRIQEIDPNKEIYIVDQCPRDFTDTDIRSRCEGDHLTDDAFYSIPVTSKDSGVLYRNFYCAQCGGETHISFWKLSLNCEHIPEPPANISSKTIIEGAVRFVRENRQFCGTLFDPPSKELKARTCKSNIGRCDRTYPDKKLAKKCRGQTSYVYVGLAVFKNKHCAMCNYVNESYLSCEDTRTPRIDFEVPQLISAPYSIQLDLNTGAGSITEHRMGFNGQIEVSEVAAYVQSCPDNHVYDHFKRKCRMLVCTDSHHVVAGDCLPINPIDPTPDPSIVDPHPVPEVVSTDPPIPEPEWPYPPDNSRPGDGNLEPPYDYNYEDEIENPYPGHSGPDFLNPEQYPEGIVPYNPDRIVIDPHEDSNFTPDVKLDCPKMKLNDSDYRLFQNHSIYVFALNQVIHAHQIEYDGKSAYICAPQTRIGPKVNNNSAAVVNATVIMFDFTYLQSFISFVGLLVSMMALFIMIVMYLFFKQLRGNVAGKCAMSLALSLFVAQGLFLFGMDRTQIHNVCLSLGALMHYFFLAAFFWLNAMAFDIFRTFANSYEAPSGGGCGCYSCYALYAWLSPAVIVGASLSLDFLQFAREIYQPRYAEHICWIVKRYALLFLFALPVAVLLAVNILLYIMTLLRSINSNKEKGRGRLLLYIQLSFVMGLTWIFAFIATLTDMYVFWYLFIAFNALQGIFICFAFVCNRKVFRIIKSKGKVHRKDTRDVRFSNGHHRTFSSAKTTFLFDGEAQIIAQETSI